MRVRVGDRSVTAQRYRASSRATRSPATLILAHGAGAGQTHPFMVLYAEGLAARGVDVVTFDFVYMAEGRKLPDAPPLLEACWRAVIAKTGIAKTGEALFIGGKSMGGRIASMVAAQDDAPPLAGLVFLGYPLHAPGKAELRAAHLPRVRAPMLFCQGTRDPFGTPSELRPIAKKLHGGTEVLAIDDGDHSFAVPKRGDVAQADVHARVLDAVATFVARFA